MKMERIEIKIKSKRHFADVALLVDKPSFIERVIVLRKKWKITPKLFNADYQKFYANIWSQGNSKAWENFNKDIERIRSDYQRLPNFDKVIFYAIACNEVADGIYSTCYLDTIVDPNNDPNDETLYKYAIVVTPNTTIPDIRKVMADFRRKMKTALQQENDPALKRMAASEYKYEFGPKYTPSPQNVDNIPRDRKWYWQKQQGLTYEVIAKKAHKENYAITTNGVFEAVKSYKLKLQKI